MREIVFRGKMKTNNGVYKKGDWVWGCFVNLVDGKKEYPHIYGRGEVVPETVGQYIGIKDKRGKRIFEGDILAWNSGEMDEDGNPFEDEISLIVFSERFHAFVQRWQNGYEMVLEAFSGEEHLVIGNIYDNPELFESEVVE